MHIANPIYDVTFKRMMENNRIAKFLLGTILRCEILSLESTSTEYTTKTKEPPHYTVTRLDFAAKIHTKEEGEQEVLIEVQKANHPGDILRFRRYLGSKYQNSKLPLITVYFLGFKLDDINAPATLFSVGGQDLLTNMAIETKNKFVKLLTHASYIIQVPRINRSEKSMLNKLLTIFDQKSVLKDAPYISDLHLKKIEPEMKEMVDVLQSIVANKRLRAKLEKEEYDNQLIEDYFDRNERMLAEKDLLIEEKEETIKGKDILLEVKDETIKVKDETIKVKDETIKEKEVTIKEKEVTIKEKDETIKGKDETIKEKEETIKEKDETLLTTVNNLHKVGMSTQQISKITGLSVQKIVKILKE